MLTEIAETSANSPQDLIRLLQAELAETNREVMLMTVELDKRVAERTAELGAAQEQLRHRNAELLRRTTQLEAANKELETFSYSVSHDLRAPLRHINGYLQALQEEASGTMTQEARGFLEAISASAQRMNALIEDLLAFSRMSRASMSETRFEMTPLVEEVVAELAQETRGRNIQWEIPALPAVSADRPLLKQVWANLLSNAVKYTRPRDPAVITVGYREHPGQWEFFVRDNGVGFDMRYAGKLFGVFQRLHDPEEFEGTGIGLANVRQIIRRHGGETRAESQVERGTTVYFSIPKPDSGATR
jgi:light-regulated signal transduction histidine kinase (bacteriophytochrome)